MRLERLHKENRVLRNELSRARQQNEKSLKIEEFQNTLNEILKRITGHAGGAPTQRVPMEHISTAAEKEIDMLDVEGPRVGSTRRNYSGAQADDTENMQEPKTPRSNAKKVDVLQQMIDKLVDKMKRMLVVLLTRLNKSDAERNAQHASVNTQLLAMN
ncbi:hypothetical protein MRX96_055560 [Rhipicephalus microplus]